MVLVIATLQMIVYKIVLEHGVVVQKYLITIQMLMVMVLDQVTLMPSVMHMLHQDLY